jgi:glyoxylase-like metal-dependent hydrolase (beta-lactamase superfamily II)
VKLTDDVYLVGGGTLTGFGVSADFDAHCYLLNGGDEVALVDCGMGTAAGLERVSARIRDAGVEPESLERLLITHYHTDHAGGASVYREQLGLEVATGQETARALSSADHDATSFTAAKDAGIFPADYDYPACPVADELADGDERSVGRLTVRYLETPGHCGGHGSFLVSGGERVYLLGGKLFLQGIPDCDLQDSLASVRKLAALEFDALLPGHGAIALDEGRVHVDLAAQAIDRLAVPPNII